MSGGGLEKTFDLPTQEDIAELEGRLDIEIPNDAALRDVVKLALDAYKKQLEEIHRVEPRYRARAFEVAQLYLQVAKDALGKDGELEIKKGKLEPAANKTDQIPKKDLLDELARRRVEKQQKTA